MLPEPIYDIHNPYPLSQLHNEWVWEGQYDEDGNRLEVDVAAGNLSMAEIYQRLGITPEQLIAFCEKWQIKQFGLFGSILREDFRTEGEDRSDIDVLFTLEAGVYESLLKRVRIKYELEELCHRSVDLIDRLEILRSHNWLRRHHILQSEQIIYAKQ